MKMEKYCSSKKRKKNEWKVLVVDEVWRVEKWRSEIKNG